MKLLIFCLSILTCISSRAYLPRVEWGIGANGEVKFNSMGKKAPGFGPWGSAQIWLCNTVKGSSNKDLSLFLRSGFSYDNVSYSSSGASGFATDHILAFINPEGLVPLRDQKTSVLLGFGLEYVLKTRVWLNGVSSSDIMSTYYYGNLEYKERKLLPFLTCGITYRTGTPFSILLIARQYLQNKYYNNEHLDFGQAGASMNLVHRPFCVQLGLLYNLSKDQGFRH